MSADFILQTCCVSAVAALAGAALALSRLRPPRALAATLILFNAAATAFVTNAAFGSSLGPLSAVFTIGGASTCGFSWLLARALFRDAERVEIWAVALVAAILLTGVAARFAPAMTDGAVWDDVARIARNIHVLTSSAVLVAAAAEAFAGYRAGLEFGEKRFRWIFAASYLALLLAAVLWVRGSDLSAGRWDEAIEALCAVIASYGAIVAVAYRSRHPLPRRRRDRAPRPHDDDEARLAEALMRLIREERIHLDPDVKVAHAAAMLNAPEYKVSRAVTGALGFANFNRLINRFRIETAKEMLTDPDFERRSILSVAMACGFGSAGPFNRAFKDEAGVTPSAFRAARRSAEEASYNGASTTPSAFKMKA